MKATVLGASGFIGRNLVRHLQSAGYEVATPGRHEIENLGGPLGRVFYCIGMTGNFRDRPLGTVDVHAGLPGRLLEQTDFESFVYFSSTRIYAQAAGSNETSETAPIAVTPSADTTYDLSKMLGEALCLSHEQAGVKVIRLSNVYGPDQGTATFLGSLLEDLAGTGQTTIREAPGSSKDYVAVDDVVQLAERIARTGRHRTYNVASGQPVSHEEIAEAVRNEGLSCTFTPGGVRRAFPQINIERIRTEFGFSPRSLLKDLPALLRAAGGNAAKSRVDS
ncbi:NAD-dependent epimerase/dehydratase family protein [Roseibium sp. Sym1]|uniref:NAD-dependent epimerase/dehydratase family protein n=1 Tax=Roseibium sp. Sym1 TaxID=3016006 RepID=UPI0022B58DE9|nr:NAD(P)-dependent oxidoreductase [Roseibium sp. Sym1]